MLRMSIASFTDFSLLYIQGFVRLTETKSLRTTKSYSSNAYISLTNLFVNLYLLRDNGENFGMATMMISHLHNSAKPYRLLCSVLTRHFLFCRSSTIPRNKANVYSFCVKFV